MVLSPYFLIILTIADFQIICIIRQVCQTFLIDMSYSAFFFFCLLFLVHRIKIKIPSLTILQR